MSKPVEERSPVERIKDALFEQLGCSAYDCTRVWEAWSVGTMSEDDFVPVSERIEEVADALDRDLKYSALQTSHEDLVDALHRAVTEMKFWAKGHADAEIFIAEKALTNAAKLAPTKAAPCGYCGGTGEVACSSTSYMACPECSTRAGGSGCER